MAFLFGIDARKDSLLQARPAERQFVGFFVEQRPCAVGDVLHGLRQPVPAVAYAFHQALGAVGGRDAREVGDFVEQALVNLVPDSREYGNAAVRDRTAKQFAVEIVQVGLGTAAAYDADDVQVAAGHERFQRRDDARFRLVPLHPRIGGGDGKLEMACRESRGKVLVGRGLFAGDESNLQRNVGEFQALVLVEQPFEGEPLEDGGLREREFAHGVDRVDVEDGPLELAEGDVHVGLDLQADLELFLDGEGRGGEFRLGADFFKASGVAAEGDGRLGLHVAFPEVGDAHVDHVPFFGKLGDNPMDPDGRGFAQLVFDRRQEAFDRI